MRRSLVVLVFSLLALIVPATAEAQNAPRFVPDDFAPTNPLSHPSPPLNDSLVIRLVLNRAGGDAIELENIEQVMGSRSFDFVRNLTDVLGVGDRYEETFPADDYEYDDTTYLDIDGRLVTRQGGDWLLNFNTSRLSTLVMDRYRQGGYTLQVCGPEVRVSDTSSVRATVAIEDENCRQWKIRAGEQPIDVRVALQPDESKYWDLVAVVALGALISTLVLLVPTYFLRRSFKYMRTGAIVTSLCAMALAILTFLIALIPFSLIGPPIDDVVLARDLGVGGHVMAVLLPALLCSVPFLAVAIGVVQLKAAPGIGEPAATAPTPAGLYGPPPGPFSQGPPPQGRPSPPPTGGPPLPDWLTPSGPSGGSVGPTSPPGETLPMTPAAPTPSTPPAQDTGSGTWLPDAGIGEGSSQSNGPATARDDNQWQAPT